MAQGIAEKRAYMRGYNLINGTAILLPRPAADIVVKYNAEPVELRAAFMRGVEAAERTRGRFLLHMWEESRSRLTTLAQTERTLARCWAMNVALGYQGLYDATARDGHGQEVCARSAELRIVLRRLVRNGLLKPEAVEEAA